MKISQVKSYNYNNLCGRKNLATITFYGKSRLKKQLDKRELIDNLIRQRNDISTKFLTHTHEDYLTYAKNCCEIEPTKRIREMLFMNKPLIVTREMHFFDKIISQSKLPQDTILYRACTPFDFGLPISAKDFVDTFFKDGEYFRIPIYPRTTLRKNFAKYYAKEVKKGIKENPILFKIFAPKNAKGIYADELPNILPKVISQMEEEIILPRKSIFKFKAYSRHNNYEQIDLDLITSWFKVPFLKKIHNFKKEANIPPSNYIKGKNFI